MSQSGFQERIFTASSQERMGKTGGPSSSTSSWNRLPTKLITGQNRLSGPPLVRTTLLLQVLCLDDHIPPLCTKDKWIMGQSRLKVLLELTRNSQPHSHSSAPHTSNKSQLMKAATFSGWSRPPKAATRRRKTPAETDLSLFAPLS